MRIAILLAISASLLLIASCEDNTVNNYNNYYGSTAGAIIGTVSPVDAGIIRATSSTSHEAAIDQNGFFHIDNLPAGVYELTVLPASHSKRVIHGLLVGSGEVVELRNITLSTYPYPIYHTAPADGDTDVSTSSIVLSADEGLDLNDLTNKTHFSPALEGSWSEKQNYDGSLSYTFRFVLTGNGSVVTKSPWLLPGSTYQVTVDSDVKTVSGEPLGKSLTFSFTTRPFRVDVSIPMGGISGRTPIWSFTPHIQFELCCDPDSVAKAISFEPAIDGFWFSQQSTDCRETGRVRNYAFFPGELPLLPSTKYLLIVSDNVTLVDGIALSCPDTTVFVTEPYGVESVTPSNGSYSAHPTSNVSIQFNVAMDTASVETAFSLTRVGGERVAGAFDWYLNTRRVMFSPDSLLQSGDVYKVLLLKSARTASGVALEEDFESYFGVQ